MGYCLRVTVSGKAKAATTTRADVPRIELARLAAKLRLSWWTQLAGMRFAAIPRSGDDADAELVRLEALAERPSDVDTRRGDPQLDELVANLKVHETSCERARRDHAAHPLYQLRERAQLDDVQFELFLLALSPEIDDGFGRVAVFMRGGGASRRVFDVATAAKVLQPNDSGGKEIRRALAPSSPLDRFGLIALSNGDTDQADRLTLTTLLTVPPPVVAATLGLPAEDATLRDFVKVGREAPRRADLALPLEVWARLEGLFSDPLVLPLLEGPTGVGRGEAARALFGEQAREVVEVEVEHAPGGLSAQESIAVARLAWLRDAALVVRLPAIAAGATRDPAWLRGVAMLAGRHVGRLVLVREPGPALPLELARGRRLTLVPLQLPEPAVRQGLWQEGLGADSVNIDWATLSHNYPLTPVAIARASEEARLVARARRGAEAKVEMQDIVDAVDVQFAPKLQTVGRRLRSSARLADLVLPEETRETLQEMEATIRLRHRVLDEWNFQRLVRGRGVSALFYGEPGTGKTMSAGALAAACGLPLYQIDTAQVVSKWIGETEKNLGELFRAAEAAHAMLLFDEADAIFGKRTDVEHSTDRYANMQTNFLLTQIELFNGISILTTNRESVMDPAFQRRLTFRVYYPMPDVAEREDLWRKMVADHGAELGAIDTRYLAQRLVMSGGYIRNAVLRGAYLAAAAQKPLSTETLRLAAELVLRDAGKVI